LETTITTDGARLVAHTARPPGPGAVPAVVLCHGFPTGPRGAVSSASTFPELADRIAREAGCLAVAFNFRGTGGSAGDFSASGWLGDIAAVVSEVSGRPDVRGVWLVGVAEGGTLAVCAAAADERVRGVATLAAPPTLRDWAREPGRLLDYARRAGMVSSSDFPSSVADWGREMLAIDALAAARRLAPRPLLVLHGSDDDVVPVDDARTLAEAGAPTSELRIVQAAGHELRHDPRAIAALLGWVDRLH
jgi:putative redox protein